MTDRQVLVTGCPRSGTLYMARLLKLVGVPVRHEKWRPGCGIVDWGLMAGLHLVDYIPDFDNAIVLHQVRNPISTIESMQTMRQSSLRKLCSHSGASLEDAPLVRLAKAWLFWNAQIETFADITYRVEDIHNGSETWCRLCELLNIATETPVPKLDRSIHTRQARYEPLDAQGLHASIGDRWYGAIQRKALAYGYAIKSSIECDSEDDRVTERQTIGFGESYIARRSV